MRGGWRFKWLRIVLQLALMVLTHQGAVARETAGADLLQSLAAQGVASDSVQGVDPNGLPVVCGTVAGSSSDVLAAKGNPHDPPPTPEPAVPNGYWRWECVPNAIRADGIDTFRVEVEPNRPVTKVLLQQITGIAWIKYVSGPELQEMRDDGLGGDRVAGDGIFTSSLLTCNTNVVPSNFYYLSHPLSVPGVIYQPAARPLPVELNGYTNNDSWFTPEIAIVQEGVGPGKR